MVNPLGNIVIVVVIELLGLVIIYFLLKRKIEKALSLDSLLESVRKEVRALNIELNETTDRNISLIEDRVRSLHELLDEADRRIGVAKREQSRRETEAAVYTKLGRVAPILGNTEAQDDIAVPQMPLRADSTSGFEPPVSGPSEKGQSEGVPELPRSESLNTAQTEPIRLPLGTEKSGGLKISQTQSVIPPKTLREAALDLYRHGFSAEVIANKLGATVAEIELLISLEEGSRGEF